MSDYKILSADIPCLSFLKGSGYALYVGPKLSSKQRGQLYSNNRHAPVIYLPEILGQLSKKVVRYNFPGIEMPRSLSVQRIYEQVLEQLEGKYTNKDRLIVRCIDCEPIEPLYQYQHTVDISDISDICDLPSATPHDFGCRFSYSQLIPESLFDDEMRMALMEAEDKIRSLILKGCPPELLLRLINQSIKLSRLKITRQLKIFLVDYDNQEIKMSPLPKTIFLFFLRHPEGVCFSHLQDHRDELLWIYSHVCTNDDKQKMEESIDRLIDPFDNSICEKCAMVKKAFILKIADNIAYNYYISGAQGERKGIPLDRSLVEWECEI